ncbi:MAG: HTTM domain-containing protein, partial [Flavobacteriaceae bacterium]|nr:HTTM domain-containing protein [Flavobacteriaceae bacterium]
MISKLHSFLHKPISASIVSLYRIIFGCFMIFLMIKYMRIDYVVQFMTGPEILFPYQDAYFLKPFSVSALKFLNTGLLISVILIALGIMYRYAMIYFFIVFTYFTFIDKTLFNNHLYLISLISLVMIFMNA